MSYKKLEKISDLNKGSMDEIFAKSLKQLLDNIADASTEATAKRSIVLTIEITPTDDREQATTTIKSKVNLAPIKDDSGSMGLGLDADGKPFAEVKDVEETQNDFDALLKSQEQKQLEAK